MKRALARARRQGSLGAVIHLAVDRLGSLERRRGVAGVDALLREFAECLPASLCEADTLLRLDRNLFGIVLEELHRPEHATLAARRLVEAVAARSPEELGVTASAGLALVTCGAIDVATLDSMAAAALARAQAEELVGAVRTTATRSGQPAPHWRWPASSGRRSSRTD